MDMAAINPAVLAALTPQGGHETFFGTPLKMDIDFFSWGSQGGHWAAEPDKEPDGRG
jgi:hypothetical protein